MMRILVADDDFLTRQMIETLLIKWGYDVITSCNGNEAWNILKDENGPRLAILDWMMPEMDGAEICRKVRQELPRSEMICLILLTSKGHKEDIVEGLKAGANDYITKPFNHEELQVRVQNARQMIDLQSALAARVKELEEAMAHIKILRGFLPICSYCKKIRNDQNYWQQLEIYLAAHSDVQFSHGICPECYQKYVKPELEELKRMNKSVRETENAATE
ncbi:response regulator [Desulfonema magnum]|uniref:Two component system response regulator n=1 Tax=Desulfonema magnum TaxID=45655 RepID=A0A975GPF7_9BACT|nr:response regulator transcription factor [Desulfonema magnum]QTA88784.1 Two component system response regulator [Desulfonema magnum]